MTEHEWLTGGEPGLMLTHLVGTSHFIRKLATGVYQVDERQPFASDRKLRLLACAVTRLTWSPMTPWKGLTDAIRTAEAYADGKATRADLDRHHFARNSICNPEAEISVRSAVGNYTVKANKLEACDLIRDVFGNPFRPVFWRDVTVTHPPAVWKHLAEAAEEDRAVVLHESIRTRTVVELARGIYEDRAFDRMPVLADALEESGCADNDILAHCRSPGPHFRGCHVVDAILGLH